MTDTTNTPTRTTDKINGLSVRQVTADPYTYTAFFRSRAISTKTNTDRRVVRAEAEAVIRSHGLKVGANGYDWAYPEFG